MRTKISVCVFVVIPLLILVSNPSYGGRTLGDEELRSRAPGPLSSVEVPVPRKLNDFVKDKRKAEVLGKALFWDMQVGSDGQACASCHFHAGADNRAKNQLSTGFLGGDFEFDETPTGGGGPNYTLKEGDFPFPADGGKDDVGLNDVASSMGVFKSEFLSVVLGEYIDHCALDPDPVWQVTDLNVRRVEPRHTPTTINAVFNLRNFWDGRANDKFNGVDPLGKRSNENGTAGVWKVQKNGKVKKVKVELEVSSLASQAVGPPLSDFEMSCAGRTFPDLGKKMLSLAPLALQGIAVDDSLLAPYRDSSGKGLNVTYTQLIQDAFRPEWWAGEDPPGGFSQMEANFSLFFGLAVQLYEATLVSDETPFDRFAGGDDGALTEQEKHGLELFLDKGRCINCHAGPEFTGASVRLRACPPFGNQEAIERMLMGDGNPAVYDGGFYNIGVRPTFEDIAVGADLAGFPLSFSRQEVDGPKVDEFCFDPDKFEIPGDIVPGERVAVDGAFKVPTVRNVELTAPYFHSGGHSTLEQVVEFYDRGGDFPDLNRDDLDPDIRPIGFKKEEEEALVAFMKALTDPRVNYEIKPFDHPQLFVPKGHVGDENAVDTMQLHDGYVAKDDLIEIPAVGEGGRGQLGLPPLGQVSFDANLGDGGDGEGDGDDGGHGGGHGRR